MKQVADSNKVSTTRRRLARSEEPVSVMSTMASTSPEMPGLASVAPQENSTSASTPRSSR